MFKLNQKKSTTDLDENTKIGITLLIFGIFILASVIFISSISEKNTDESEYTFDLINQGGKFFGGALVLAGVVLIIKDISNQISRSKKP